MGNIINKWAADNQKIGEAGHFVCCFRHRKTTHHRIDIWIGRVSEDEFNWKLIALYQFDSVDEYLDEMIKIRTFRDAKMSAGEPLDYKDYITNKSPISKP